MWFGKNKEIGEANIAIKKKFSEEIAEQMVQIQQDVKMHGQGTVTYANGDECTGEWIDGKRDGQGTYTWADGATYIGEWKDDKQFP